MGNVRGRGWGLVTAGLVLPTAFSSTETGVVTSTWTGAGGDGAWTTDANWANDPPMGGYPNNGNQGFNYNASIGPVAVMLSEDIEIETLVLDRSFISGANTLVARMQTDLTGLAGFDGGGGAPSDHCSRSISTVNSA